MTLQQWGLAVLWLAAIMVLVAVVLGLVALADRGQRATRPGPEVTADPSPGSFGGDREQL